MINGFTVEDNLDLIGEVDIEGIEAEVEIVGGIRDLEAKGNGTIGFCETVPALSVLGAGSATKGECLIKGGASGFKSDLMDTPLPGSVFVNELKGVGAAD